MKKNIIIAKNQRGEIEVFTPSVAMTAKEFKAEGWTVIARVSITPDNLPAVKIIEAISSTGSGSFDHLLSDIAKAAYVAK